MIPAWLRLLVISGVGLAASGALAQSRTVLRDPGAPSYAGFDALLKHEVALRAGDRLPGMSGGEAPVPAVVVSLAVDGAYVWDRRIVAFQKGAFPRSALATCPRICSVALRDAAARALAENTTLLASLSVDEEPRFLLVVDTALPYEDLLIALGSLAAATLGGPAQMDLLVSGQKGYAAVPILCASPTPLRVGGAANLLLLQINLVRGGWEMRAMPAYLAKPLVVPQADIVASLAGDMKSRDPARKVVHIGAPGNVPIRRVVETMALVREEFPTVVLKGTEAVSVKVTAKAH